DRVPRFRHGWARGWLDRVECSALTVEMARQLGRAPIARLLRALVYGARFFGYSPGGDLFRYAEGPDIPASTWRGDFYPIEILAHYPAARNVRLFQYGAEVDPEEDDYHAGTQYKRLAPLIERMPRLEELCIFGHIYMDDEMWEDMFRILSLPTLTTL